MEAHHFDQVTKTLGVGSSRRRALAGLLAGTGAMVAHRLPTRAAKKKRCTGCPQRACCSCLPAADATAPSKCAEIEALGLSQTDADAACIAYCGGEDLVSTLNLPVRKAANSCLGNHTCRVTNCPVPLD
jgi:hypothetical protein